MKNKKQKITPEMQKDIEREVIEMWNTFNGSPEDRQHILEVLDEAAGTFPNKPHVVGFFKNLKAAFLESEGH